MSIAAAVSGRQWIAEGMVIQPKLTIGEPNDKYEREADRIAEQVVHRISLVGERRSQPDQALQRETLQAKDELEMKPLLQRDLVTTIQQSRSSGQPLADSIRQPMERAFGGIDFSGVRIHADARSDQLNRSLQANAFTTGHHIFFRQGSYEPGSIKGQELIAHELMHVVQQRERITAGLENRIMRQLSEADRQKLKQKITQRFNELKEKAVGTS